MKRFKYGIAGTAGLIAGAVIMFTTGAFGAGTTAGSLALQPNTNLGITCANSLTNASVKTKSETVQCAANPTTTTTPPTTTPPTTAPPTTTPPTTAPPTTPPTTTGSGSGGSQQCVQDGSGDNLGPFNDPNIYNSNGYNTYAGNDEWAVSGNVSQKFCATDASDWTVAANDGPTGYDGVQTYPDTQQLINDGNDISAYTSLSSSFTLSAPSVSGSGAWEAAYDIWTTGGKELMVWVDTSNERLSTNGATVNNSNVSIGGQSWTDMSYGGSDSTGLPILMLNGNETSGTVNLNAIFQYWESVGALSSTDQISQINFGYELCNTAGTTENFGISGYTLSASV